MEFRTISPEDVKSVATNTAQSIPIDEIDTTFKSQYTGEKPIILAILKEDLTSIQISYLHLLVPKSCPSVMNSSLQRRIS